jgi:hypothetical protein
MAKEKSLTGASSCFQCCQHTQNQNFRAPEIQISVAKSEHLKISGFIEKQLMLTQKQCLQYQRYFRW